MGFFYFPQDVPMFSQNGSIFAHFDKKWEHLILGKIQKNPS